MADDLIERLKAMNADPIGCGLERRWLRNPDGPEAAEIGRLRAAIAATEARAEKAERERDAARAAAFDYARGENPYHRSGGVMNRNLRRVLADTLTPARNEKED